MIINRREVFQPEDLDNLGSAFDQTWTVVGCRLGDDTDPSAARTRLADIVLRLARLDEIDPEEIKRTAIRIFQSDPVRFNPGLGNHSGHRPYTLTASAIEGA
jgi:hypothetical protein